MSEGDSLPASAGALLRAARERQGLHIAALAAAIKVAPRKLDALENDRWHELPDATFARALAQTVCRALKIDAQAVLERMPAVEHAGLENVAGSLNTPFRERGGALDASTMGAAIRPMVWAGLALMVAAAAVYLLPADTWSVSDSQLAAASLTPAAGNAPVPPPQPVPAAETPRVASDAATAAVAAVAVNAAPADVVVVAGPAVDAASAPQLAAPLPLPQPAPMPERVPAQTAPAVATAAVATAAGPAGAAQLHALQASWVEARDGVGKVLVSRQLAMGEKIDLDGKLPLRLTIGNAGGTAVAFRGRPVDLGPITRGNVARLELQ